MDLGSAREAFSNSIAASAYCFAVRYRSPLVKNRSKDCLEQPANAAATIMNETIRTRMCLLRKMPRELRIQGANESGEVGGARAARENWRRDADQRAVAPVKRQRILNEQ